MRPEERRCATVKILEWVTGPSARGWTYWLPAYMVDLKKGDWVVVESPRDGRGHLVESSGIPLLAQVAEVDPPPDIAAKATRWLVAKVDWEPYRALRDLASEPDCEGV